MFGKLTAKDWEDGTVYQIIVPILVALLTFSSLGWHTGPGVGNKADPIRIADESRPAGGNHSRQASPTLKPAVAEKKDAPVAKREVVAWLPGWDQQEGLKSFSANAGAFSQVSPFWYGFGAQGELQNLAGAGDAAVTTAVRDSKSAVIPTITNDFDGAKTSGVLNDPAKRSAHITAIVNLVESSGYAGIDVDYEAMPAADRNVFSQFVTDLGAALHARGRLLSVTVLPKVSEPGNWSGPQSLDYAAIGKSADQVRIMAYDQHYPGGPPGPIAPLDWVDKVVAFSVSQIPKEKVFLGIPSYAYDWAGSGNGKALMLNNALAMAASKKAPIQWDAGSASPHFDYAEGGVTHTVWFENEQSLAAKLDLAKRYDIGGVALWRLGRQPDSTWQVIRSQFREHR